MNRAIIDIGTNSVRLLEARKSETGEWDVVRKEINSTRLGEGMTELVPISIIARFIIPSAIFS